MLFGANKDKGLVIDGWEIKAITIGQDGYTIDDVLVHDVTTKDDTLHMKLGLMDIENGLPVALGVIRDVESTTYEAALEEQIKTIQDKNPIRTLKDYLMTKDVWEVK